MSATTSPLPRIRISGRSFLALTLTPEAPLEDWLSALDHQITRSAGFFAGKPIILDLGMLDAETEHLAGLLSALKDRGIRVIGIEGGDRNWPALAAWEWPESFAGGRASAEMDIPEDDVPAPPARARLFLKPLSALASRLSGRMGMSSFLGPWPPARKSRLVGPSIFMAPCAGGPLRVLAAMRTPAFSPVRWKRNWWRLTVSTQQRKKWMPSTQVNRLRLRFLGKHSPFFLSRNSFAQKNSSETNILRFIFDDKL